MRRNTLFSLCLALCAVALVNLLPGQAAAQPVIRVKLASMVPAGSTWHELLKQMGAPFEKE